MFFIREIRLYSCHSWTSPYIVAPSAETKRSRSPFSCPAQRLMRRRLVPRGTVGGRMAGTRKPASRSARLTSSALRASPITSGMIWVAIAPSGPAATLPKAGSAESRAARRGRHVEEFFPAVRFSLDDLQRFDRGGADGGRQSGGVDERPAGVADGVDEYPRAGDETAQGADRLGERADDDIDVSLDAQQFGGAGAVLAEHAGGVGLVDKQAGVEATLEGDDFAQGARSPSMEKSESVTIRHRRCSARWRASRLSRRATSRWG